MMVDSQFEGRLLKWLREAGEIARPYYRNVVPEMKDNNSYVTAADRDVQTFLAAKFDEHFPAYGIIAEEDGLRKEAADGTSFFTIDPIDGTSAFVSGTPTWGIGVGIVQAGQAQAGYFYMPAVQDMFHTNETGAVYRNGQAISLTSTSTFDPESVFLTDSGLHRSCYVKRPFRGKVRSLGSIVAHLSYVATGSADAALVNYASIWDLIPGVAMLQRQGGIGRYMDDGSLFTVTEALLAGGKSTRRVIFGLPDAVDFFLAHVDLLPER